MSSPKFTRITNISLFQKCETGYIYRHPVPLRMGVGRRHDEGRVAVDAEAATDARGQSVRRRRVVLTSRCWRRRWQQYMAHRGERVISRKAIAQGNVGCSPLPCMLMRALFVHIAHEIAGAARIRHSLRPLFSGGEERYSQTSGAMRRENAATHPVSSSGLPPSL